MASTEDSRQVEKEKDKATKMEDAGRKSCLLHIIMQLLFLLRGCMKCSDSLQLTFPVLTVPLLPLLYLVHTEQSHGGNSEVRESLHWRRDVSSAPQLVKHDRIV